MGTYVTPLIAVEYLVLLLPLCFLAVGLCIAELTRIRRERTARVYDPHDATVVLGAAQLAKTQQERYAAPHPSPRRPEVDANICDGGRACVDICPEGVFSMRSNQPVVSSPEACLGHGQCVTECRTGAIKLHLGSTEREKESASSLPSFATRQPGIFVVGEVTGKGRIRHAMRQGVALGTHLASRLPPHSASNQLDVAVVGAGPAGLACAAQLVFAGYAVQVFEKDRFGVSVTHFPRENINMGGYISLPGFGGFGGGLLSKTELIAQMEALRFRCHIPVSEQNLVTAVNGEHGDFVLTTKKGMVRTRVVVLAIGLRGYARQLGIPGEGREKVAYELLEPLEYAGKSVLVVGGGQQAVTTAISLAQLANTKVTLSYRRNLLSRCSTANRLAFAREVQQGRIQALFESTVNRIDDRFVELKTHRGPRVVVNDKVIICVGRMSTESFLQTLKVQPIVKHEEKDCSAPSHEPRTQPQTSPPTQPPILKGMISTDDTTLRLASSLA
ncbi:MAG: NAD(P)-binding domain-containing protein [Myxococcales bacterium]|nr:NAD(P)-binding domain-containing protein [Myxococcales bacterium]